MPRLVARSLLISAVLCAFALLPGSALAAPPADGARVGISDYSALNHVIVAWPESTGDFMVEVEAVESLTDPMWVITFVGPSEPSPGTVSAPCTQFVNPIGPDYIECPVASNAALQNGIEVWTGDGTDSVFVAEYGTAAPAAIFLRDGTGTQLANGGHGADYLNASAGDDNPGGATYLQGGAGLDQYVSSPNAYDVIDYRDLGRGTVHPVNVTFDCVANDGNAAFDGGLENAGCTAQNVNGMQGTDGNDTLTGDGGSNGIYGQSGNDVIDGGDATDQLLGGPGDDTITGGGGHDQVDGDYAGGFDTGADTIYLRDGLYDQLLSCGGGADSAQLDAGTKDIVVGGDCETLDRGDAGGGGGGGTDPNLIDPTKTFTVPNFMPYEKKGRLRFVTLKTATKQLDSAAINLDRKVRRVPLRLVKPSLRTKVEDGDIVTQLPQAGWVFTAALAAPYPRFDIAVYEEALDYKGKRCPYKDSKKYKPMLNAVEGGSLQFAQSYLKKRGCKVTIVKEIVTKSATDSTVRSANIKNQKTKRGRELAVALMVERPPRQDFRIHVIERPPADFKAYPKAAQEIGIGTDDKLTAGLAPAVLHLDLFEALSGRGVKRLSVQVVRPDGVVLASTKTSDTGGLTFTVPVDFTGELDIRVVLQPLNSEGTEVLEAWQSLDVVDRKKKPFSTKSGRYFKWSAKKNRYLQTTPPPTPSQVHAAIAERMRQLTTGLVDKNPAFAQAAAILSNTSATPQQLLQDVANNVGLLPGVMLSGAKPDGKMTAATIVEAPAVQLLAGGYLPTTMPVALLPKTGAVDTATLIGPDGGSLIGLDGGSLVGMDGASLVGMDGATLVGMDGATLTSIAGSGLVGMDGATLQSGMKLISDKGVGLGGGGFVPVYR